MKYKIGDRVRVVRDNTIPDSVFIGATGVLIESTDGLFPYNVRFDKPIDDERECVYEEDEIVFCDSRLKKLLIIGSARHGKDTFAEMLKAQFGYSFKSSSEAAAEIFIYKELKDKYGYQTPNECFEDRVNHRAEWYDMICEFNRVDRAKLAKEIMKTSDIYVGMRDNAEIEECLSQKVFDLVIGVYDYRKPEEDKSSFNINLWEKADIIIPNSGSLEDLLRRVKALESLLYVS